MVSFAFSCLKPAEPLKRISLPGDIKSLGVHGTNSINLEKIKMKKQKLQTPPQNNIIANNDGD